MERWQSRYKQSGESGSPLKAASYCGPKMHNRSGSSRKFAVIFLAAANATRAVDRYCGARRCRAPEPAGDLAFGQPMSLHPWRSPVQSLWRRSASPGFESANTADMFFPPDFPYSGLRWMPQP
jgi:hypothetical protein